MRAIGLPIVPSPWHSHRMTSAFWDRLTEAFADAGYETSQSGVARRMGVGQSAVAKWANGTGLPTLRKCIEIARITGVNTEWLVSGRGSKKEQGASVDETTKQLLERIADASDDDRKEILAFVEFKLATRPATPPQSPKK